MLHYLHVVMENFSWKNDVQGADYLSMENHSGRVPPSPNTSETAPTPRLARRGCSTPFGRVTLSVSDALGKCFAQTLSHAKPNSYVSPSIQVE